MAFAHFYGKIVSDMSRSIQNWAFVAPKMSRDLSEYFEGILDFIKDDPSIFLHAFTFADSDIGTIADMDGVISYTVPPPEVMSVFRKSRPPIVAITMCKPTDPRICAAHINPDGVAARVADLLVRRNCRVYAFCSSHAPYFTDESSALLKAYRRQIFARTGQMPRLFRPISTLNVNLIESEVTRFTAWCAKVPKPCGMFVHGDDVARKMLDACRLKGIKVPDELRVVGTGNSPMYCERTFPTLSSYAIDHHKAATEAARILRRLIVEGISPRKASYEIPLTDVTERASSVDARGSARLAQEARDFIRKTLQHGHAPTARDIAFHLNISIRKIENDFSSIYRHTLRDEIAAQRLDLLCTALRTSNEPIKPLVARSGFGDMSQATRAFKAKFGQTMSAYRASRSS